MVKVRSVDLETICMRIKNNLIGTNIYIRNYEPADKDFCTSMWLDEENGRYLSDPTKEFADDDYRQAVDNMYNLSLIHI